MTNEISQRISSVTFVQIEIHWCFFSSFKIIGSYFFDQDNEPAVAINVKFYANMLEHFLVQMINGLLQYEGS
jgi:hypothetical protein